MLKYVSNVEGAPAAIGPYSQAVIADNLMFLSGQIPINPTTGKIDSDDIAIQAKQVLQNIFAVLSDQGFSFKNVVKATIFLTDLSNFQIVNEIYESFLAGVKPARSTVQVAALPRGAKIEIEMIAVKV